MAESPRKKKFRALATFSGTTLRYPNLELPDCETSIVYLSGDERRRPPGGRGGEGEDRSSIQGAQLDLICMLKD